MSEATADSVATEVIVADLDGVGSFVAAAESVAVLVPVVVAVPRAVPDAVIVPLSVPVDDTVGFIVRDGVLVPVVVLEEVTE